MMQLFTKPSSNHDVIIY